ncbi:hypothetical protein EDD85DRAFT_783289 [Armillaria nabsnona]|nr:hypothetical protein EDD85DRAFT_783289 [Armillaria nabsnona]
MCPNERFPRGRRGPDISGMGKLGREVLVPIFMAMAWSQVRKELAIGFPNIKNRGDEDWEVVATLYGDGVAMPSDVGIEGSGAGQNCVLPPKQWEIHDSGKRVFIITVVQRRCPDHHPAILLDASHPPTASISLLLPAAIGPNIDAEGAA